MKDVKIEKGEKELILTVDEKTLDIFPGLRIPVESKKYLKVSSIDDPENILVDVYRKGKYKQSKFMTPQEIVLVMEEKELL